MESTEKYNPASLIVHHRDDKTGQVKSEDAYVLHVIGGENGEKMRLFERPKGSGNVFDGQGRPAGRWDKNAREGSRFLKGVEHIAFTAPETQDQKLKREMIETNSENAALKAELAAIKAEKESRDSKSADKKPGA